VKGSASIEMLVILIVAIYMAAIVYKGVVIAGFQFAEDEFKTAMAKLAADKIANTAHFLKKSAPGTTKKVDITLPSGVTLVCKKDSSYLEVTVDMTRTYTVCKKGECKKQMDLGLKCSNHWELSGPVKKETIGMVKIGGDHIKIGVPE